MTPRWSTACPGWEELIVERKSMIPFSPLFPDEAAAALAVFKSLRVPDLPGQPTFGEVCDEWVFEFVAAIFGAYNPETAQRLITNFLLLISKKNGKSMIAAAIMLTALIRNWRHSAELLILAPTMEVANNSFGPAADIVRADPQLLVFLRVRENRREIMHLKTRAVLKVVAADVDVVGGKKAGFILVEELWAFGPKVKSAKMLLEATGGLASRPEGFVIYLSTHSDEEPEGIFKEKVEYFRDVRDGKTYDPKSFGLLYEFPARMIETKAYEDPRNWYVTNPNLGRSVSLEFLEDQFKKARHAQNSAEAINNFISKHLNVQIGGAQRTDRWVGAEFWEAQADKTITFEELFERCDVIVIGLDGGGLDDLYGFAALGRDKVTKDWLLWTHAWAHRDVMKRRPGIAQKLLDLEAAGELTFVGDELDDVKDIVDLIERVLDAGLLGGVWADPAGIGETVDELAQIGVTQTEGEVEDRDGAGAGMLFGAPQGIMMMSAIKTVERRLVKKKFWHNGGALMRWCVGNLKIERTATAIRATKQFAGDAKIDPAMGMFNAAIGMSRNPKPKSDKIPSGYRMPMVA